MNTAPPLTRILYVDDDPDLLRIVQLSLTRIGGWEVKICTSGQEALERALNFQPDLILLDVMMPDMDGPTTLLKLKDLEPLEQVPVVFMTAKVHTDELSTYRRVGAVDIIFKPFPPLELPDVIRRIWTRFHQ